jgi:hypothetical protein
MDSVIAGNFLIFVYLVYRSHRIYCRPHKHRYSTDSGSIVNTGKSLPRN